MNNRIYISAVLGVVFVALLISGLYLNLFPPLTTVTSTVPQQKESTSNISLPTPISPYGTRQAIFQAQSEDHITFDVLPCTTDITPVPIKFWGDTVTVNVYFGTQLLFSNTAGEIEGTVNLAQTGTYTFQIVNENDFGVVFVSSGTEASYLQSHHPYTEYSQVQSQVPNTSLQSLGFVLIISSIGVGIASLVTAMLQPRRNQLPAR